MAGRRPTCQKRPLGLIRRKQMVEQVETYLRAHIGSPVNLAELCRLVGTSERSLRNAFYETRGMGPKRFILHERLRGVQGILRDAARRQTTVTGAATRFGFYELGRFAGVYREFFGEMPSDTLRRASVGKMTPHAIGRRGDDACT